MIAVTVLCDSDDSTNDRDIDWQADINEPVPATPSAVGGGGGGWCCRKKQRKREGLGKGAW